jgi:thioredoxin
MKKFRKRVIKMAKILGKDNFNDTIANGVTLVDFWAEWCGPCRMQLPILEEVSEEIGEKATVGKINVDHELELAQRFGVQSIPTLILFKDGEIVDKMVGVQAKETLVDKINNAL